MRPILAVLMIAGAVVTTGCSSLLSLQPVVTEQETTFEPALVGAWSSEGDDDLFVIRQTKDRQYRIRYGPADFDGRLFRAGNAWFLDVTHKEESALQVPAHAVVRLWLEGDTLRWTFIESD